MERLERLKGLGEQIGEFAKRFLSKKPAPSPKVGAPEQAIVEAPAKDAAGETTQVSVVDAEVSSESPKKGGPKIDRRIIAGGSVAAVVTCAGALWVINEISKPLIARGESRKTPTPALPLRTPTLTEFPTPVPPVVVATPALTATPAPREATATPTAPSERSRIILSAGDTIWTSIANALKELGYPKDRIDNILGQSDFWWNIFQAHATDPGLTNFWKSANSIAETRSFQLNNRLGYRFSHWAAQTPSTKARYQSLYIEWGQAGNAVWAYRYLGFDKRTGRFENLDEVIARIGRGEAIRQDKYAINLIQTLYGFVPAWPGLPLPPEAIH